MLASLVVVSMTGCSPARWYLQAHAVGVANESECVIVRQGLRLSSATRFLDGGWQAPATRQAEQGSQITGDRLRKQDWVVEPGAQEFDGRASRSGCSCRCIWATAAGLGSARAKECLIAASDQRAAEPPRISH